MRREGRAISAELVFDAALLELGRAIVGAELTPVAPTADGGLAFEVRRVDDVVIRVLEQRHSWRLVARRETEGAAGRDVAAYCYFGRGVESFARAARAGAAWAGPPAHPADYDRDELTGVWRDEPTGELAIPAGLAARDVRLGL